MIFEKNNSGKNRQQKTQKTTKKQHKNNKKQHKNSKINVKIHQKTTKKRQKSRKKRTLPGSIATASARIPSAIRPQLVASGALRPRAGEGRALGAGERYRWIENDERKPMVKKWAAESQF
jgi:hypothetical protein